MTESTTSCISDAFTSVSQSGPRLVVPWWVFHTVIAKLLIICEDLYIATRELIFETDKTQLCGLNPDRKNA